MRVMTEDVSIRAPHFHAGRRLQLRQQARARIVSIRAPHFHAGRRHHQLQWRRGHDVSIRAPHFHAGRLAIGGGLDRLIVVSIRAPHFHAGRLQEHRIQTAVYGVSIRAPHFHAGRRSNSRTRIIRSTFQSAPRTFMRGDVGRLELRQAIRSFNPRPALSCGATGSAQYGRGVREVSIRAPHFHAGRRSPCRDTSAHPRFQSAPRTFMRGDAQGGSEAIKLLAFQSAPRTFMRGDFFPLPDMTQRTAFQSAPRTFMRGDFVGSIVSIERKSFNPRPALSCGATGYCTCYGKDWIVSIRAPHFHAGRPACCRCCLW